MKTFGLSLVLLAAASLAAGQVRTVDPASGLTVANSRVRLEFEAVNMGLAGMTDLASGVNHIRTAPGKRLLWEAAFARGTQIERITNNYKPCTHARIEALPGGAQRAVMEWNDLRFWKENKAVSVRVVVDLPPDSGIAQWRISVENFSDYWGLWTVSYPLLNGFPASGEYDMARPAQSSGGHLRKALTERIQERYPSGNWPMQFLSLSRGRDSIYFGTFDSEARAKDFLIEPGQKLALIQYPEGMGVAGSDLPDYFPIALGVYQGNWVEAAQHYRPWALRQAWARAGKISQRTDMPDIVKNVGIWVQDGWIWNGAEGSPEQMNAPLVEAQKRLDVPLAIHWYNWHQVPFDNQYPHFLPSKPGFRERVKELVGRGVLAMPYINGLSSDMNIPDFDRFAGSAIVDEAGGFRQHFYSDASGRLLSMCPTPHWQATISKLVDDLFTEEGVNGVYIDQISSMGHELCFARNHNHPAGGGNYWAAGYRELMRKARSLSQRGGRRSAITSEGTDEIFFDFVDANLTWSQTTDWEIPLMQAVYSGYTLLLGSPCDFTRSMRFFAFAQGQAFLDGKQNGWMSLRLFEPQHKDKADYLRQVGKYRVAARKFLTYGTFLRPVEPSKPVPTFTDDNFGWHRKHRGSVPGAEARLWQSEDGHLGVLFANYLDEPVVFPYRIDAAQFGLKAARLQLTEIAPDGNSGLGTVSGAVARTENLGPRSIRVIEIAPARQ